MINEDTPYKLAEIIRDTWPQLYRPGKVSYNEDESEKEDEHLRSI